MCGTGPVNMVTLGVGWGLSYPGGDKGLSE